MPNSPWLADPGNRSSAGSAHSELGPHRGDDKMSTAARLVFLSDEPEALIRVKLIDPRMPPICIAWLGAFMPVSTFVRLWERN